MSAGTLTVRALLLGAEHGDVGDLLARSIEEQGLGATIGRAVGGLTEAGRHAVCEEAGEVAESLLSLDPSDVLVAVWRKQADLVAAGRRTLATPGAEEIVQLATHRVVSKHRPSVDILVDGVEVTRIEMELSLVLAVRGMLAVVRAGRLVAVRTGTAEVSAALSCEKVKVLQRTATHDLPGMLHLGDGIVLAGPDPTGSAARRVATPAGSAQFVERHELLGA